MIKKILLKIVNLLEIPVKQTNWYNTKLLNRNNYPTNQWYRKNNERNFDIVNIGSSSILHAFDYEGLNVKAYNWALQPQSLDFCFYILKTYFSILKKGGTVCIGLSPFTGITNKNDKRSAPLLTRYLGVLNEEYIDDYGKIKRKYDHPLLYDTKKAIKHLIRDIPPKYNDEIQLLNSDQYKTDAENWIKGWMNEFSIKDLNLPVKKESKSNLQKRKELLIEIIDFCKERELNPVVIIPPVHSSLRQHFTLEFHKNYIKEFISVAKGKNVIVKDFLLSDKYPDELFLNSFFLNKDGAKKFTKDILSEINF